MTDFISLNLGDFLKLGLFLIMGGGFVYSIKSDVRSAVTRIVHLEGEVSELRKVVVTLARQEERLSAMDQRSLLLGKRVDEAVERMNRFIDKQAMHA